ncbi:hypothetical protein ABPG74_020422 [Tetrahymena malaccensis]
MFQNAQQLFQNFQNNGSSQMGFPTVQGGAPQGQVQQIKSYKKPAEKIYVTDDELKQEDGNFDLNLKKAKYFLQQDAFNEAIACLKKAVEQNPNDTQAYLLLGQSFRSNQQFDDGFQYFQDLEKKNEKIDVITSEKAKFMCELKKFKEAIEIFKQVEEKNPQNKTFYSYWAYAHNSIGQHDFAIYYCREGQKANPYDWFAPYNLGYAFLKKNRLDTAINFLTEAQDVEERMEISLALGQTYLEKQEAFIAEDLFQRAIDNNPNCSYLPFYYMAKAQKELKQYDKAIENISYAESLSPDNPEIQTLLAEIESLQ